MSDNYSKIKQLYMDYYRETCRQEELIADRDYQAVNDSITRRGEIIGMINSIRSKIPAEKWQDISEILQSTIQMEKRNNFLIKTALKEARIKLNNYRNKRNNISQYNTQNLSI